MRPNGAYGGNGAMNCTGFVAYVLEKCGADLSGIDQKEVSVAARSMRATGFIG